MKPPLLRSLRVRNFKAIRDSGFLKLTPLTVLIGNNGSGKSSVIEALETLRTFVLQDLDAAMQLWRGIEHIRHKAGRVQSRRDKSGLGHSSKPIVFIVNGHTGERSFSASTTLNERHQGNELFIERESVRFGALCGERDETNWFQQLKGAEGQPAVLLQSGRSALGILEGYIQAWQLLPLSPQAMGTPVPQTRTRGQIQLAKDGANIAEYQQWAKSFGPGQLYTMSRLAQGKKLGMG